MSRIRARATAALSSLFFVAAACDRSPTPIAIDVSPTAARVTAPLESDGALFGPEVNKDLALLRQVTAQLHDRIARGLVGSHHAVHE